MSEKELTQFIKKGFNHIPIFRKIDVEDKNSALLVFLKLADKPYSYLFESSLGDNTKWGRYSIIGCKSDTIIKVFDYKVEIYVADDCKFSEEVENPLDWIDKYQKQYKVPKIAELPDFYGGLVGFFGYESVRYIETKLATKTTKKGIDIADILLMVSNDVVVIDRLEEKLFLITHINPEKQSYQDAQDRLDEMETDLSLGDIKLPNINTGCVEDSFKTEFGREEYKKAVEKIQDYIVKGDVMQVVPSQRLFSNFTDEPTALYRSLTKLNPSPYMYYLDLDDTYIVGSSPEILTRIEGKQATVRPLAGTRKRGNTETEDLELEKELLADEKEIAEHLMLIDLGRNDLGRVAKIGSVKVSDKMNIERYSHVMHIVSNVECTLKDGISAMDVFKATFPAGTLSGAPKVRAMEIIDELEPTKRNIYSGAIGYLSWHGGMDLAIAIRTAVIKDKKLYIQAGAGIVYDSVPEEEWQETMSKARAVIKAAQKNIK